MSKEWDNDVDGGPSADEHYSEEGFWDKAKTCAKKAGEEVLGRGFTLYYCLQDSRTPAWARATIVGALGYWILPIDAIPDLIPGAGYADDLGALAAAAATVSAHIKPEHKEKAQDQVDHLFGSEVSPSSEPSREPSAR